MADVVPDRREYDLRLEEVQGHVATLRTDVSQLKMDMSKNTELTERISEGTAQLVDFWQAAAGAFKVLKWLGYIAKWVGIVAGAVTAVFGAYFVVQNGGPPIDPPK